MNVIIHKDFPVGKLSAELRGGLGEEETVNITVEKTEQRGKRSTREIFGDVRRMHAEGKIKPVSTEEAVARVRALRDEWDR